MPGRKHGALPTSGPAPQRAPPRERDSSGRARETLGSARRAWPGDPGRRAPPPLSRTQFPSRRGSEEGWGWVGAVPLAGLRGRHKRPRAQSAQPNLVMRPAGRSAADFPFPAGGPRCGPELSKGPGAGPRAGRRSCWGCEPGRDPGLSGGCRCRCWPGRGHLALPSFPVLFEKYSAPWGSGCTCSQLAAAPTSLERCVWGGWGWFTVNALRR